MLVPIVILLLALSAVSSTTTSSPTTTNSPTTTRGPVIKIDDAPYQVSLQQGTGHFCGGTILTERYILTAARCVYDLPPEDPITIHAGSGDLSVDKQIAHVVQINIHPYYNSSNYAFNVAILQLNPVLVLGLLSNALPANIRRVQEHYNDTALVTVTGWGTTSDGIKPGLLQGINVTLLVWEDHCQNVYGDPVGSWMCGDTCVGKAGDPVRTYDKLKVGVPGYVVGIVSYEPEECRNETGYVYTWIESEEIRNFITEITGEVFNDTSTTTTTTLTD